MPVLPGSALADPCWSFAHGRFNSFRCRVELSAVTRLEHEVDCACGCRRIDILQPCPVGSPPPTGPGGARRSHDHRTDQRHRVKSFRSTPRCRSPQHARRREVPSRSTKPTTSATSDPIAQLGMSRRAGLHLADDRTDLGAGPNRLTRLTRARAHADAVRENAPGCHQPIVVHRRYRHTRTGRRRQRRRPARIPTPCSPRFPVNIEHLGRRSRSISPAKAGVGVTRLMSAGGAATSRLRPAFNPTVGGVTGTSPRYGNRNRRRTSRHSRR